MNKEKWKERMAVLKEKLAFLKPWDMDEDPEDDLEIQELHTQPDSAGRPDEGKTDTGRWFRSKKIYLRGGLAVLAVLVAGGFYFYNRSHTFTEYVVTSTDECLDIDGTEYVMLGKSVMKYSPDGVFCVNTHNEANWSIAYSMQTPVASVCEKTMAIVEQQGNQVYVLNEEGLLGNFETDWPILKARVSAQGVVALVLDEEDATVIELRSSTGEAIAAVKTTVADYGYPLDIAITSNASRMAVSFLGVSGGSLNSKIAFFDFSSASVSDDSHLAGTLDYPGRVFPQIYYADSSTAVALGDTGFVVLRDGSAPQERASVEFEDEIISTFWDEDYVGFVFPNDASDSKYRMELYTYQGRRRLQEEFDTDFEQVKMERGEILLYDAKNCTVYTAWGTKRFSSDYEKQVNFFAKLPGFRSYLIVSNDSMDHIRIS